MAALSQGKVSENAAGAAAAAAAAGSSGISVKRIVKRSQITTPDLPDHHLLLIGAFSSKFDRARAWLLCTVEPAADKDGEISCLGLTDVWTQYVEELMPCQPTMDHALTGQELGLIWLEEFEEVSVTYVDSEIAFCGVQHKASREFDDGMTVEASTVEKIFENVDKVAYKGLPAVKGAQPGEEVLPTSRKSPPSYPTTLQKLRARQKRERKKVSQMVSAERRSAPDYNVFNQKLYEDPLLSIGLGEPSPCSTRRRNRAIGAPLADEQPGFPGISIKQASHDAARARDRKLQKTRETTLARGEMIEQGMMIEQCHCPNCEINQMIEEIAAEVDKERAEQVRRQEAGEAMVQLSKTGGELLEAQANGSTSG